MHSPTPPSRNGRPTSKYRGNGRKGRRGGLLVRGWGKGEWPTSTSKGMEEREEKTAGSKREGVEFSPKSRWAE